MKKFVFIPFRRGATMWEGQIWRIYWSIRYRKYWSKSGFGYIRLTDKDGNVKEKKK
jgi:hypothetical protein